MANENMLGLPTFAGPIAKDDKVLIIDKSDTSESASGTLKLAEAEKAGLYSDWIALPFGAGWQNIGSGFQDAQYRKVGRRVELRGIAVRASGSNTIIGTLPSGFRPADHEFFPGISTDAINTIAVYDSGDVNFGGGGGNPAYWVSLSGIWFQAAQIERFWSITNS